jgi:hypothetical protein
MDVTTHWLAQDPPAPGAGTKAPTGRTFHGRGSRDSSHGRPRGGTSTALRFVGSVGAQTDQSLLVILWAAAPCVPDAIAHGTISRARKGASELSLGLGWTNIWPRFPIVRANPQIAQLFECPDVLQDGPGGRIMPNQAPLHSPLTLAAPAALGLRFGTPGASVRVDET